MYSGPTCKVQDRVRGFFGASEVSKKLDREKEHPSWGTRVEGEEGEEVAWLGLCSLSSLPEALG